MFAMNYDISSGVLADMLHVTSFESGASLYVSVHVTVCFAYGRNYKKLQVSVCFEGVI